MTQSSLHVRVGNIEASPAQVLPHWTADDRFGIVVDTPLGALGASLLIQAATTSFYDADPARRTTAQEYPEIYLFHVGGRFGDHSYFDFWPPRKEVFVPLGSACDLLDAINDRAITRLAIPDGRAGDLGVFTQGTSTWAEQSHARRRLRSCFAYHPSGATSTPDFELVSTDDKQEVDAAATFRPRQAITDMYALPVDVFEADMPGPSVRADIDRWAEIYLHRIDEVPAAIRQQLANERSAQISRDGRRTETYRCVNVDEALQRLAALGT